VKTGHQCCFCGNGIVSTNSEPVGITVSFKDESSQALWAHIDCLGGRLHESVPWLSNEDRRELGD